MTDKTTLEQLFRQHYRTLFQLAMTLLHDEAESQDVVSEVFARLMSDGSLLPDEREESYLLAAVRNRCLNVVRNRSIQQRIQKLYLMEQEMATKSPARLIEEARVLERGVGRLEPPVCRQIIKQHFEESKTFREIAQELGVSETTVYKHLRRAMQQLRQHLNKELEL